MVLNGNTVAGYLKGEHEFFEIDDTEFTDPLMKDFSFEDETLTYDITEGSQSFDAVEQANEIFQSAGESAKYLDDRLWDSVKAMEASVSQYGSKEFSLTTVREEKVSEFDSKKIANKQGYGDTFMAEVADEFRNAVEEHGYEEIASELAQYE